MNPAALAQMQGYRSDKQGAERFASTFLGTLLLTGRGIDIERNMLIGRRSVASTPRAPWSR